MPALPQWSVYEAQEYLQRSGWTTDTPIEDAPRLNWSYQRAGEYLLLYCGTRSALFRPQASHTPLAQLDEVLLMRKPLGIALNFGELWPRLNAFYGRSVPALEQEAINILEVGNCTPLLERACLERLPTLEPETPLPLRLVYKDWYELIRAKALVRQRAYEATGLASPEEAASLEGR